MSYWTWEPSLEIGVPIIDSQHRQIVDYINTLSAAIAKNEREEVGHVLDELVTYTLTHFAFEEELMEKGGYRFLETHRKVHENFTHRIEHYRERFQNGEDVSRKLLTDLKIWLTNHIQRDDKDYAPFVGTEIDGNWLSRTLKHFFG
jgi:hemerythrin